MTNHESTVSLPLHSWARKIMKTPMVGCFYSEAETTFTVWAPLSEEVHLLVNDSELLLTKDDFGYWNTTVNDVKPGDKYFFKIGDARLPDPASMRQADDVHGASFIVDRDFNWSDHEWHGMTLREMILYELHVGTFTEQGTFDGVLSKIEYLKSVGVNAIELMPIAQFPGDRNWGYDGVFPFAVQESYGGINGLKRLVDACHQHGIAVILDVVYNHVGPEGNYLEQFGPYFTDKYKTGWGKAINYDDAHCDGVRNFFLQNALMWLDEFHIDGLRLDAVHAIWDSSAVHFIEELKTKVASLERQTGRKKILIAEFDLNNPRYINAASKGGYDLDGQWIDEFHHALHSVLTGETNGYYEDFGKVDDLHKAYRDSYVYTGQYSKHRKKNFGTVTENTFDQFVVFAQNHDQIGNRLLGDRLAQSLSFEKLKLAAAAYLLSPYVPMLFMGEEYGEKNPFQYFISHSDKKLIQAVREGRKKEFEYFGWKEEVPDPQSIDTFLSCKLSWNHESDERANTLLEVYRFLIKFRKTRIAMKGIHRDSMVMFPLQEQTISFIRSFENDSIAVVLNFSKDECLFQLPFGKIAAVVFDSSSTRWGGPNAFSYSGDIIRVAPHSALIFELTK